MEFLEGLAVPERSAVIQDWDTAGRVYLDYIRVIQTLHAIQQVHLSGIVDSITVDYVSQLAMLLIS